MAGGARHIERPGMRGVAPTRIAVVGAGGWGAQHGRIAADRVDTDLVAIVGRSRERTR